MRTQVQRQITVGLVLALAAIAIPVKACARVERYPIAPRVASFYPEIPSFNSQRLNQQLYLYRQYLLTVGAPDILIVGSSRSLQGIDPVVLQQGLAAQGYPNLKVYNFGVNGATAQVVDLVVRQLLLPDQLPRMLIWGDGLRAFNNGRPDATYDGILRSTGYQQRLQGQYPISSGVPLRPPQPPEAYPCSDQQQRAEKTALLPSRHLSCQSERALEPAASTQQALNSLAGIADLEVNGFRRVFTQFQPASYFQRFPRVPGNYDGDYVPFRLQGGQMQAMQALARYVRQQQMGLLFVSLPLSQYYLDAFRLNYERQFQQQMQAIAQREGFMQRDWTSRWATENRCFVDPSHLNQAGAAAVAQALAADSTIPWAQLLEPKLR